MHVKAYIGALSTIIASAWLTPWLDELIKIYVLTVVVVVTLLVNLVFWFHRIRESIINHLVASVIQQVLADKDVQKIIDWAKRREEILSKIKEEIRQRGPRQ